MAGGVREPERARRPLARYVNRTSSVSLVDVSETDSLEPKESIMDTTPDSAPQGASRYFTARLAVGINRTVQNPTPAADDVVEAYTGWLAMHRWSLALAAAARQYATKDPDTAADLLDIHLHVLEGQSEHIETALANAERVLRGEA
jgi:hypothetical protein